MKRLTIIRHAKSSWKDLTLSDIERPLNKRGIADAMAMSKLLLVKGVLPDRIITSPAERAMQTTKLLKEGMGISSIELRLVSEIYGASVASLWAMVASIETTVNHVAVIGHNPTFTNWVNEKLADPMDNLPTTGVVHFEFVTESWQNIQYQKPSSQLVLTPKQNLRNL